MEEFNAEFGHKLAWLPWQRPGFELGMMLRKVVAETPGCDGVVLGGHGLFTWGDTQRECYLNTITIIDQIGQFIERHAARPRATSVSAARASPRATTASRSPPGSCRACAEPSRAQQRFIGSFTDSPQVLEFVNSTQAQQLAHLGTSCPDHFIRTKIRPLFVDWNPADDPAGLPALFDSALETYRAEYAEYYTEPCPA